MKPFRSGPRVLGASLVAAAALLGGATGALLGVCGPFTDVSDVAFCPFVLEIFTLGITTGTSPTTYDPTSAVSRLQMAAFLSRTVDGVLMRGSRRAALDQFSTPQNDTVLGLTTVGLLPQSVRSDGADLWAASLSGGTVTRVRGSDGKLLETWTAPGAGRVLVAMGNVFATAQATPGRLYRIDPSQTAGAVTTVATLGNGSVGIAFDGSRFWTANWGGNNGVSIVTPGASLPWTVTTVTTGFVAPIGPVYDGANIWVTDFNAGSLLKLDGAGAILQTVTIGGVARFPAFDGSNLWVPAGNPSTLTVVRASNGAVVMTLLGNGLNNPIEAAFDGQRVLVTNFSGNSVSLWKAADLTPLGFFATGPGTGPQGACSDGVNFWITLSSVSRLARF